MASSEQLEREAQAARAQVEATLAELRARVSPGQMLDEAIDYARERNGAEIVKNFGRQVSDNPMPVALMGAGLAWLMFAQRQPRNGRAAETKGDGSVATTEPASLDEWTDRTVAMASKLEKTSRGASRKAQSARSKPSDTAASAYDKAQGLAGSAYERAGEAMDRARETTAEAYDRARDAAGRSFSSAADGARGLTKFMAEEPMVVAGLGIALGAIIGALLPATELENRAMGETSDQLKRDAREAAREQWQRGKDIAEDGWDEAKNAARRTWEDAKVEAQQGWDETKRGAGLDGHAGELTGMPAPLVPSEGEAKAAAAKARSSS
ncbi:MAG TPA: DUF3618 domain-containing protein [Pseudolabrys sp.]|nr:DUF3618 domain-containing protein [Pseudolabrys sp.]